MKKKVVGFVATVAMAMMMCTSVFAADTYTVAGSFTNWADGPEIDLVDADGDGIYEATVDLEAGEHKWKVRANKDWTDDWGTVGDDGVTTYKCPDNVLKLDAATKVKFTFDTTSGDKNQFLPKATPVTGDAAPAGPGTGDTVPFAAVAAIVAMMAMGYSAVALKKTR